MIKGIAIAAFVVLCAIIGVRAWLFFGDAKSYVLLTGAIATVLGGFFAKKILPGLKPKDFTPDQINKIKRGEDPFAPNYPRRDR